MIRRVHVALVKVPDGTVPKKATRTDSLPGPGPVGGATVRSSRSGR
jgi:hypothetical protein